MQRFLSTLSLRRATYGRINDISRLMISIHALLAESDALQQNIQAEDFLFLSTLSLRRATGCQRPCERPTTNFYPRSPCGERRFSYFYIIKITGFLSTLSLRRATRPEWPFRLLFVISIHALLAESDDARVIPEVFHDDFYPRSPCGERHWAKAIFRYLGIISIHALLAESD